MVLDGRVQKRMEKQAKNYVFPYGDAYVDSHREFALRMFAQKKEKRSNESFIRWKFRGPTSGDVENFLVAVQDGQVIGQIGMIPMKLRVGARVVDCQWLCDLMVDDSIRKMGVGAWLLLTALSQPRVSLGNDPSEIAQQTMLRLGMTLCSGPLMMYLPVTASYYVRRKLPHLPQYLQSTLGTITDPAMMIRNRKISIGKLNLPRVFQSKLESVKPLMWEKEAALDRPHIVHDDAFLNWRIVDAPNSVAEQIVLQTETDAYAICEANVAEMQFFVNDWGAHTPKDALALTRKLIELARQSHCEVIKMLANTPDEKMWLEDMGFLNRERVRLLCYGHDSLFSDDVLHYHCYYDADRNV